MDCDEAQGRATKFEVNQRPLSVFLSLLQETNAALLGDCEVRCSSRNFPVDDRKK